MRAHKGVLGLVEGGVSMWGLKGVAWQPPPALRNGRHTRHTHILPPSPFPRSPSSFAHPSSALWQDTVPRIIHIPHPTPAARGGKFLNFARIENFHILFPRREAAGCWAATSSRRLRRRATAAIESKNFPNLLPSYPTLDYC